MSKDPLDNEIRDNASSDMYGALTISVLKLILIELRGLKAKIEEHFKG